MCKRGYLSCILLKLIILYFLLTPLKYDAATELNDIAAIQITAIIFLALSGVEIDFAFIG